MEKLVEVLADRGRLVEDNKVVVMKDMVGVVSDLRAAGFSVEPVVFTNTLFVTPK